MLDENCPEVKGAIEQGLAYQHAIKEAGKGHDLGAPHLFRWAGLVGAIERRGADVLGKETYDTIKEHQSTLEN